MKKMYKITLVLTVFFFAVLPATAGAANIYLTPSSGSYTVGSTIPVSVFVSATDQAMNAASGVISFPQDILEITSLSKSGSIISLWPEEPSFLNKNATAQFEGIVLNPGYAGTAGKIVTINFRVRAAGTAVISFSSGSVLANDGDGTDITTGLGTATFSFAPVASPGVGTPVPIAGAPSAPKISSPTHPDSDTWYSKDDAEFTWSVPADVTAARLLVDNLPEAIPSVYYEPAIDSKTISDLDDGIWYIHVRLRNSEGWGATSHFRFQIDTTPPEPFVIVFLDGRETFSIRPRVTFSVEDTSSGIAGIEGIISDEDTFDTQAQALVLEYKIDNENWFDIEKIRKGNIYILPKQKVGEHLLTVRAFDRAGNMREAQENFTILPPTVSTPYYYISLLINFVLTIIILILLFFTFISKNYRLKKIS